LARRETEAPFAAAVVKALDVGGLAGRVGELDVEGGVGPGVGERLAVLNGVFEDIPEIDDRFGQSSRSLIGHDQPEQEHDKRNDIASPQSGPLTRKRWVIAGS